MPEDLDAVLRVERLAFGSNVEADLVATLIKDPSAAPFQSLLAVADGEAVGHVLFTRLRWEPGVSPQPPPKAALLAPLAVVPERQRQGVGQALIKEGLSRLRQDGVQLVLVLGHPEYYPRSGFTEAGKLGIAAPYPIAEVNAPAWMVLELQSGSLATVRGTVRCADALDEEQYWRE